MTPHCVLPYVTSRIAPDGTPRLTPTRTPDGLGDAARTRLADAFAESPAAALLHLGATEPDNTAIPAPLALLRDVGKLFVTCLCASPDLESLRDRLVLQPPDDLARLADATPPMPGAEYVDAATLARWWNDLHAAYRAPLGAHEGSVASWLHGLALHLQTRRRRRPPSRRQPPASSPCRRAPPG